MQNQLIQIDHFEAADLPESKQNPNEDLKSLQEDQLAAGLAAVIAYVKSQEEQAALSARKASAPRSGWLLASRLEGTGATHNLKSAMDLPVVKDGDTLWRSLIMFLTSVSLLGGLLSLAPPARAQQTASNDRYTVPQRKIDALLKQTDGVRVRVALAVRESRCNISLVDGGIIADADSGNAISKADDPTEWSVALSSKGSDRRLTLVPKASLLASTRSTQSGPYKNVGYFPTVPNQNQLGLVQQKALNVSISNDLLRFAAQRSDSLQAATTPPKVSYPQINLGSGVLVLPSRRQANESEHLVSFNGKLYRGFLWIRPCFEQTDASHSQLYFQVINVVDVEDYLLSVLPSEMPSSWPQEALKAQAIAARSYALANIGKYRSRDFDLKDTVDDQVYSGVQAEQESTNRAVSETAGIVLKHGGKVCSAFFHSSSGGQTEVAEHVWGKTVPYLKSVPDYDDQSPHSNWQRRIAVTDLPGVLGADVIASVGTVTAIMPIVRTPSERMKELLIVGDQGARIVSADVLRRSVKLPSTNFNLSCEDGAYSLCGSGFGHGLGMSQWGARALADKGYNAAQILSYYYKDVALDYLADTPAI